MSIATCSAPMTRPCKARSRTIAIPAGCIIYEYSSGDDGKKDQKMPKFKGQLSIGIDELSNSLVVSAPAYLFEHVNKMIKELDDAAAPTSTIQVIKLGPSMSSQQTQQILSEMLGDGSSSKKGPSKESSGPQSKDRNRTGANRNRSSGNASSK